MNPRERRAGWLEMTMNLQFLYKRVIRPLQICFTLNKENKMSRDEGRGMGRRAQSLLMVGVFLLPLLTSLAPRAYSWTWDDDESGTKDELDIQVEGYRKRVEQGISLQDRIVLL